MENIVAVYRNDSVSVKYYLPTNVLQVETCFHIGSLESASALLGLSSSPKSSVLPLLLALPPHSLL